MTAPLQKVIGFIQRHAMLEGASGVLVAVSGGPDSVALLDMLVRISNGDYPNSQPVTPVLHLHIAHLDHMLRDGESTEDAEFVRALAEELRLPLTISSVDVRSAAIRYGRGIEETAREIRYNFLRNAASEAGCDRIAVGHTMTDQAETFLMRLMRGAGLRGLAAMRPVVPVHRFREARGRDVEGRRQETEPRRQDADNESLPSAFCLLPSVSPSVSIIRPLMCITREEVEAYCSQGGLRFRTDATNLSLHYTRNRIRNDVLPPLMALNPRIVKSISRTAEHLAADQNVLDDLALSLLNRARLVSDSWQSVANGTIAAYSIAALLDQPVGLRRRMIMEAIRLARVVASNDEGEADGEVTSVHVEALETLLKQEASGKHIVLPGSLEVWREFGAFVIRRSTIKEAYLLTISKECPAIEAGGFAFTFSRGLPANLTGSVILGVRQERKPSGRDWMTVVLDDEVLPDYLVVRPRLSGERTHVLGRRKTIKLKNLMIDHKIPSSRRATWPLVTTPDGAYIWSPGLPPAVEFAAHDKTKRLAIVCASAI